MTTKRKPKEEKAHHAPLQTEFKGFVNIALPDSCKEDILKEQEDGEAFERHLDSLLAHGFKITLSLDPKEGGYRATATGGEHAGESAGYATSGNSDDLLRALLALSAKVAIVADYDLSTFVKDKKAFFDI